MNGESSGPLTSLPVNRPNGDWKQRQSLVPISMMFLNIWASSSAIVGRLYILIALAKKTIQKEQMKYLEKSKSNTSFQCQEINWDTD